jgi:hypothetical protein
MTRNLGGRSYTKSSVTTEAITRALLGSLVNKVRTDFQQLLGHRYTRFFSPYDTLEVSPW